MSRRWNQRGTVFGQDPDVIAAGMIEYFDQMVRDLDVQVVRMQRMIHADPENDQFPLILRQLLDARQALFDEKRRREQARDSAK